MRTKAFLQLLLSAAVCSLWPPSLLAFNPNFSPDGVLVEQNMGDVVMAALCDVGYDGWCIAEIAPRRLWPGSVLSATSQAMDLIFAGEASE